MRIVISSAVKVFYEENDNVFFGNLNNFFAFMEQRTKEYNKITKTEFNSILKSRAQKAVAFPIGYARKIMIDIKNKSSSFREKLDDIFGYQLRKEVEKILNNIKKEMQEKIETETAEQIRKKIFEK